MAKLFLGTREVTPVQTVPTFIGREITSTGSFRPQESTFTLTLPSNVTTINGTGLYYLCAYCTGLTKVDLPNLLYLQGSSAMGHGFIYCTNLTTVDLSSLKGINGGNSMDSAFLNCTSLTTVDLSSVNSIVGNRAMAEAFRGCTSLTSLSFPSLKTNSFGSRTNQFNNMLSGVTGCTVRFPSNLQSVIGSWSDVTAGFGGTNTIVSFNLPATS